MGREHVFMKPMGHIYGCRGGWGVLWGGGGGGAGVIAL